MKKFILIISMILLGTISSDAEYSDTENPDSGYPDWEVVCDLQFTRYGNALSSGDLNGDGFDDVVLGSPASEPGGEVYIYYGTQNGPSITPDKIYAGEFYGFGNSVDCKGDFNNDGFKDLAIGNHATGKIYIYSGSSAGLPDSADQILTSIIPGDFNFGVTISTGDVNGDGYSDIISSISNQPYSSNLIVIAYVFFGSSNGIDLYPGWIATVPVNTFDAAYCFVTNAGDINNDGCEDVLIGLSNSNAILIYNGSPNKGFTDPASQIYYNGTYEFGYSVSGAGDVNSDGYDDISIGSRGGIVFAFYGSQNGIANTPDWSASGLFNYYGYVTCSAGDFNNDGYGDISVDNNSGNVNVFFGNSSGLNNIPFILNCNSYHLSFGDINGDSISDIITFRDGRAYGFFGSTDTASVNDYILATIPVMNTVNADKSTDISIVFNRDMNVPTLTENNIKVSAEYTGIVPVNISYNPLLKTLIIDPQNDFREGEKISVTLTSGIQTLNNLNVTPYIFSFLIEATGGTGKFHITDSIDASGNVKIGDVDVDGDIDLIVGNTLNSIQEVKIYKNDGHGHFSHFRDVQGAYQFFTVADFDSDGDPDILSEAENDQVRLFLNDGLGNFSPSLLSGGFIGKPADLDGDGDPDIARIYTGYDVITAKNENGLFVPQDPVNIPVHCQELYYYSFPFIEIADMDNDGDPDIAEYTLSYIDFISGRFTGCRSLEMIENSGSGIFTNSTLQNENFVEGYSVLDKYSYTVLNYDNDDDVDILTSFSKGTNLGNVTYQFEAVQNIFNTIHSADFDGDGDLDITSVAYRTIPPNRIFLLNDGYGNFNIDSNLNSDDLSEILYTADFDGDGDIDILESNNSKLLITSNVKCEISGPSNVLVNSQPVAYSVSENVGFWILSNYDQTQATIVSGDEDDTVIVDPGGVTGHFVLYYQDNRTLFCAKHVYVDAPLPVELSAFTSSVNARDIVLNWTTSYELNNSGFEIERAVDNGQLIIDNGQLIIDNEQLIIDNGQLIIDSWDKAGFVEGNGTTNEPKQYTFTDKNLPTGNYKYRLRQIDFNGNFEYFELDGAVSIGIPEKFSLSQNYPNPFNPVTNLEFGISELGFVSLKIYDAVGREVVTLVNENLMPGFYSVKFDASYLSSGVYFYRLSAAGRSGEFSVTKRMLLVK